MTTQNRSSTPTTRSDQSTPRKKPNTERKFDPSKYSTRLIALKFAYLGQRYNGYEHHANNKTPLPTIEEILWKALMKAKLIFPSESLVTGKEDVNWQGCEYSKCGRTDRGVSAFGQVIGLRVRSRRPLVTKRTGLYSEGDSRSSAEIETRAPPLNLEMDDNADHLSLDDSSLHESLSFHPIQDEIPYPQVLNRLLPRDIRVLAWCPAPPTDFSARFSCRERRYRYFFTQPAFNPTYGNDRNAFRLANVEGTYKRRRDGWLDVAAMSVAAKRYEGLHDFRNFCKIDPSKEIEDFRRRIFFSEIQEVDPAIAPGTFVDAPGFSEFDHENISDRTTHAVPASPLKVYQFVLHGSAFLWHQVRHMVAILFLVGQGLESPNVVDRLLDIEATPQKPMYEMAEDAPLVLWDCIFPREGHHTRDDALLWVYVGDEDEPTGRKSYEPSSSKKSGKFGIGGLVDDMWKLWRHKRIDEILAGSLLGVVSGQGTFDEKPCTTGVESDDRQSNQKIFAGGDTYKTKGRYIPVLDRPRMERAEVVNARYAAKNGFSNRPEAREVMVRRLSLETRQDHNASGS